MNRVRRTAAVLLVTLLGIGGSLGATGPAAAAPAPGTVVSAVSVGLPDQLSRLATAKRIQYLTTNVNGAIIPATGLVLTPTSGKTNKVVAWGHGTTGLADQCAPSINPNVFWPEGRDAVAGLLGSGWTVAATDYPGLGTLQAHPYLIGKSEARAIIDSVKAARNLDGDLSTQYVVDGYSQGGQGALFAGELAPSYDGVLVLRGVVAIAPVSHVEILAPEIPKYPNRGYLVMALAGLATVEPSVKPVALLAPPARLRLPVLQYGCLNEILAKYADLTEPTDFLMGGKLPDSVIAKLAHWANPAQEPPSTSILLVQGDEDVAVPAAVTQLLATEDTDAYPDDSMELKMYPGADHEGAVRESVADVDSWIATRFG